MTKIGVVAHQMTCLDDTNNWYYFHFSYFILAKVIVKKRPNMPSKNQSWAAYETIILSKIKIST